MATRSSTPKYNVVFVASGAIVVEGVSRTDAKIAARQLQGDRKGDFAVRPQQIRTTSQMIAEFDRVMKQEM